MTTGTVESELRKARSADEPLAPRVSVGSKAHKFLPAAERLFAAVTNALLSE